MRRDAVICVLLIAATAAVYAQVLRQDFVRFDDPTYIYENEHVRDGLSPAGVRWAFTSGHASNWHPLTWLSHMLDCGLFGLDAGWHKLVNVLLHAANTLLLYLLLRRITGAFLPCAFVAAVFALHPLHVESVAWVSERKDVLSTLFWFLTALAYVGYARRGGALRYAGVLVLFALGLMAKPMLVTVPCTLLLLDFWPLGRLRLGRQMDSPFPPASTRRVVLEKLPLFAMAGAVSVVTFLVQRAEAASPLEHLSIPVRLANAVVSYVDYIVAMFFPRGLAVVYPHPGFLQDVGIPAWRWLVAAAVLVGVSVAAVRLWRRAGYLAFGWLWYLVVLVPVIGLVQVGIQARADRFTYVSMVGLLVMVAWSVRAAAARWRAVHPVAWAAAAVALAACTVLTFVQVGRWKSTPKLFRHTIAVTGPNYVACRVLGYALHDAGQVDEAAASFRRAIEIMPGDILAHQGLGVLLTRQEEFEAAAEHFSIVVATEPDDSTARFQLGLAYGGLAWQYKDSNPRAARILFRRAASEYRRGLEISSGEDEARRLLGEVLIELGEYREAVENLRRAVQLMPDDIDSHLGLAKALEELGRFDEAVSRCRHLVKIRPDFPGGWNNLAWLLATAPDESLRDGAEAVRCATRACELVDFGAPALLDTLAAAYAEAGRFDEAVSTIDKAIKLTSEAGNDADADAFAARKQLYRAGKAYRMSRPTGPN